VTIELRDFAVGDEPALRTVFESAIRGVASRDYTPRQIGAWAPRDVDVAAWALRVRAIAPFVALRDGRIVGYADVQPSGVIDHFFVAAEAGRQGVGRLLMARLHERADELGLSALSSDVSLTAQPFFAHFGFEVVEHQCFELRGVEMCNAAMRKTLR
jgi:putative acetyltransferase